MLPAYGDCNFFLFDCFCFLNFGDDKPLIKQDACKFSILNVWFCPAGIFKTSLFSVLMETAGQNVVYSLVPDILWGIH